MFPHEQSSLFRNAVMRLEYCADTLENAEWGNIQWDNPDEENASSRLRTWCERYIAAYDYHHGDKPDDE